MSSAIALDRGRGRLPYLPAQDPAREQEGKAATFDPFGSDRFFVGRKHTVTVGDLCWVALGQIVNRRFDAVRYQPTAIIIVSSPTLSPTLCKQVRADWANLTEACGAGLPGLEGVDASGW